MKIDSLYQLFQGTRKFVSNHYVPAKDAFLTCFMNDDLIKIDGYCIVKQSDLGVQICCFVDMQLHGFCLTFRLSQLISLDHYVEGQSID